MSKSILKYLNQILILKCANYGYFVKRDKTLESFSAKELLHLKHCCNGILPTPVCTSTEPEFLNILKCNSAESASAEFQFNYYSFLNDKTPNYRHLDHISGLLKFYVKQSFKSFNKNCSL